MRSQRYYWLKLHDDFFTDTSIKRLRKLAGGDTLTIIYLKLLLLSLKTDGKLYYEGLEEDFATQVALEMDEDVDNVKLTLTYLMSRGILVQNTDEEFELTTEKEMVGSESESARRMRKTRLEQKNVKTLPPSENENAQCAHNVPQCEQNVTLEIRDKREEIRDKENKKEKININNNKSPLTPLMGEDGKSSQSEFFSLIESLGEPLATAAKEWVQYKKEKHQSYNTPMGQKKLVTQIRNCAEENGVDATIDAIDMSIANGYRGIVFDAARRSGNQNGQKANRTIPKKYHIEEAF